MGLLRPHPGPPDQHADLRRRPRAINASADEQLAAAWLRDDLEHTARSLLLAARRDLPERAEDGVDLGRGRELTLTR